MSLSEIFDNGSAHLWANLRINNLVADGSFTVAGPVIFLGNLDVTGNLNVDNISSLTANSPLTLAGDGTSNFVNVSQLNTNVIQPAVPNADLVVQANGIQIFDIQTAGMRANTLEVDSIDTKTPASALQLGGINSNLIQVNEDVLADADNTRDLGSSLVRYAEVHSASMFSNSLATEVGSAQDLSLSADSTLVSIPTGNELRCNIIRSQAAQPLDLVSNGPTDIGLTSGSGLIQVGASAINGNSFLLSSGANQFSPKVDNTFALGTALLRFSNLYLGTNLFLANGATGLNWYEEFTSAGNTWTGIWAAPQAGEYRVTRIGNCICLELPFVTAVATIAAAITNTALLPAQFRPALTVTGTMVILDNAVQNISSYSIDNTGLITITASPAGAAFAGAGLSGFPLTQCLHYAV